MLKGETEGTTVIRYSNYYAQTSCNQSVTTLYYTLYHPGIV